MTRHPIALAVAYLLPLGAVTGTTVALLQQPDSAETLDLVADFGAVGDGRADDTRALQRAFDHLSEHIDVLRIPAGTYRMTSNLTLNGGRNYRIVGDGIGRTVLQQEGDHTGLWIDDSVDSVIEGLTIECSRAKFGTGLHLTGTTRCRVADVEVFRGHAHSLLVQGRQFDHGNGIAESNLVERCFVHGQRLWDGRTTAAQIIAAAGARNTTFRDCISQADGFTGDLFGQDDASGTRFVNCQALGQGTSNVGFWVEHGEPTPQPAFFEGCTIEETAGGIGGQESAERMFVSDCRFLRVGRDPIAWAVWSAGDARLVVDGCYFQECGGKHPVEGGAIKATGGVKVSNCVFEDSRGTNVVTYLPRGDHEHHAAFVNCVFDNRVSVYERYGAKLITFQGCDFGEASTISTFNAVNQMIVVRDSLFRGNGLRLGITKQVWIDECRFAALGAKSAISVLHPSVSLVVRDSEFDGYETVHDGHEPKTLRLEGSRLSEKRGD